jgi:hypothetical protein
MTTAPSRPFRTARRLARDESGGATIWMLFWTFGFLMLGGVAVDTAKAWRMEVMLRAAADAAAHAAVIDLVTSGQDAARDTAIGYTEAMLPRDRYGEVLKPGDVEFGAWDPVARRFEPADEPNSVRVTLRRSEANGNGEPTTLLRLVGHFDWDLDAQSVARIVMGTPEQPETNDCWNNGMISRQFVRTRSNNVFSDVCIHGETGVGFRNNNDFVRATLVSMPNLGMLDLPGSGFKRNWGLEDRLTERENDPWIVDYVDEMIEELRVDGMAVEMTVGEFDLSAIEPGVTYWIECGSSGTLTIPKDAVLEDMILLTDCAVDFSQGVVLIDTTIGTTGDAASASGHTVSTPAGLMLGIDDDCTPGGGARLLIDGTFHSAAKLRMNGSQIIASGSVKLAAQARGLDGFSVLAGGDIDVTSNNGFGACHQVDFSALPPRSTWRSRPAGFALSR